MHLALLSLLPCNWIVLKEEELQYNFHILPYQKSFPLVSYISKTFFVIFSRCTLLKAVFRKNTTKLRRCMKVSVICVTVPTLFTSRDPFPFSSQFECARFQKQHAVVLKM